MPTGFVKSTIQASGAASARTRSAISSTTGTVRIAFAKPPAPVVSWPMQPQASGAVSSLQSRLLAADADLDQDEVGVRRRRVELAGHVEPPVEPLAREHPPRHAADDLAALGIDVLQHELVDVEARQAGHELGRVGRSAADDRDLHSG